jgi:hypothetical protein
MAMMATAMPPGNEAIFDGRCARLIGKKSFDQAGHEFTPSYVKNVENASILCSVLFEALYR